LCKENDNNSLATGSSRIHTLIAVDMQWPLPGRRGEAGWTGAMQRSRGRRSGKRPASSPQPDVKRTSHEWLDNGNAIVRRNVSNRMFRNTPKCRVDMI